MGRKGANLAGVLIGFILLMVLFIRSPYADMAFAAEYLNLLPSVILIVISVYGVKGSRGPTQVLAYALVGVGFAMLAGQLDGLGVLVPDILIEYPSLTLQYLQALIVAVASIAGMVLSR